MIKRIVKKMKNKTLEIKAAIQILKPVDEVFEDIIDPVKMSNNFISKSRQEHELPESVNEWGWKYHHLGIPTDKIMPDEKYLPQFRFYVSGFSKSPFGIEWMRFEKDSPINSLIQTVPHIAFEVEDLDYELATRGLKVITEPNPPAEGIRVAMIEHNGAPVELIEFAKKK